MVALLRKLTLVLVSTLTLSACSDSLEMKTKSSYRTICIDGVTYVAFKEMSSNRGFGFLSVKLNRESKIIECNQGEEKES